MELSACFYHASSLWLCDATTSTIYYNFYDHDVDYCNESDTNDEHCYDDACYKFYENNENDDSIVALHVII